MVDAGVQRFLSDEREKAAAQKRGGGRTLIDLDEFAIEEQRLATEPSSAERAFDRRWAMALLERAEERLRAEFTAAGKGCLCEALQPFLSGGQTTRSYAEVAAQLAMPENSLKSAVHRLRRRYGQLIREEIAGTVETPAQIEEEIRYLRSVIGREAQ
jgi:RNA polymerase sigma-70 factor (ECF subfamily)